ncbi:MAG: hypothetical protein ACP5FZ_07680 [Fidelibacterota bacterium]
MKKLNDLLVIPVMVFILFLMLLSSGLSGTPAADQKEEIKQDIKVLEGVLDQLIIQESPFLFSGGDQVHGLYLEDFGLMFDLQSNGLLSLSDVITRSIRTLPRVKIDTDSEEKIIVTLDKDKKTDSATVDEKAEIEKSLQKTEELIIEFFRDYASTVKSLPERERICVNIRNSKGFKIENTEELKVPEQLRACALVRDLNDYRLGKMNEAKLKARIKIERLYETEANRDVEIFSRILDRVIGADTENHWIHWTGKTRAMYLEDYGVIFLTPVTGYDHLEKIIIKKAGDLEKKLRWFETDVHRHEERIRELEEAELPVPPAAPALPGGRENRIFVHGDDDTVDVDFDVQVTEPDVKIDSLMDAITAQIIDVLGQYGATLRSVKKDETILVTVNLSHRFWTETPGTLYLKVNKSDVERFSREELTTEQFRKAVAVWKD